MKQPKIVSFKKSKNPKFKYTMVFDIDGHIKTVNFGATGYSDYTIHKDSKRKDRYIARHRARENWKDPTSKGALSLFILWNKKTIKDSFKNYMKHFGLKKY